MIIPPLLTTSLIHFSLKGWENVRFELGSEQGKYWIVPEIKGKLNISLAVPSAPDAKRDAAVPATRHGFTGKLAEM